MPDKVYNIVNATYRYEGDGYGFIHVKGLWTDIVQSATGINPAGSTAPWVISTDDGLLESNGHSADRVCTFQWQLPHGWKSASSIFPHAHMASRSTDPGTGSDNKISLKTEYKIVPAANWYMPADWTELAVVNTTIRPHAGGLSACELISLGEIDMTGFHDSCIVLCRFTRVASDDTNDTYPDDIAIVSIDAHYLVNTFGSLSLAGEDF